MLNTLTPPVAVVMSFPLDELVLGYCLVASLAPAGGHCPSLHSLRQQQKAVRDMHVPKDRCRVHMSPQCSQLLAASTDAFSWCCRTDAGMCQRHCDLLRQLQRQLSAARAAVLCHHRGRGERSHLPEAFLCCANNPSQCLFTAR